MDGSRHNTRTNDNRRFYLKMEKGEKMDKRECGNCSWNDDGLCDRLGKEVHDDDKPCKYHVKTGEKERYCEDE